MARRSGAKRTDGTDMPMQSARMRPALTPEGRNAQMISLAIDAAEDQLRNGTASAQVIVHYLKMATERDRLEREILEKQKSMIEAKTKSYQNASEIREIADAALAAMRRYSGYSGGDDNDDNDDDDE